MRRNRVESLRTARQEAQPSDEHFTEEGTVADAVIGQTEDDSNWQWPEMWWSLVSLARAHLVEEKA